MFDVVALPVQLVSRLAYLFSSLLAPHYITSFGVFSICYVTRRYTILYYTSERYAWKEEAARLSMELRTTRADNDDGLLGAGSGRKIRRRRGPTGSFRGSLLRGRKPTPAAGGGSSSAEGGGEVSRTSAFLDTIAVREQRRQITYMYVM